MSFDYNAPAELFLAKPMKGSRTKHRRLQLRLRPSVMQSRTCARPERSELGCWWGMSASRVEIQRLYEDGEYPLRKSLSARGATE
jgi:hypothetical protein